LKGAPWLRQVTPASMVPYTVTPFQISWQLVVKKSAGSVHRREATDEGVASDGAFVGMSSAAHASTGYEPPLFDRQVCRLPAARILSTQSRA
jgi:hypothetical protein